MRSQSVSGEGATARETSHGPGPQCVLKLRHHSRVHRARLGRLVPLPRQQRSMQ